MNNREYFNSVAEKWDNMVYHDKNKIKYILEFAQIKEGDKILDVGTGTGILVPFLHSFIGSRGKVVAVDIAEKMIEVAKRKFNYENVEFIVGDILEVELAENYFDCIFCYSVFPHFADQKNVINKLAKCLNEGGKIVICHSQSRQEINNLHKNMSKRVQDVVLPSSETIKRYYEASGLNTRSIIDNKEMFVVIGSKQV